MRVCVLPTDLWGVGSYRVLFPARELERRGHDVFSHLDKAHLARWDGDSGNRPLAHLYRFNPDGTPDRLFDADTYIFQRRMEKITPAAIRVLRHNGRHVIGELDDNYDCLPEGSPGWTTLRKHPDLLRVEWLNEGLRYCSTVTVSTPALAEWYSRYNDNIQVLPNMLDWNMWADVPLQYEQERPRVRVGWMGMLAWRGTDLEQLRPWIRDWLLDHPDVDFVSIGERRGNRKALRKARHVTVHDYLNIPPAQRVTVKAAPFRDLPKILPHIDIGLVPLTPGVFNECKSYLKGLEYSACGIVPVATPTDQYRELIHDGHDGFLASGESDWREILDLLVNDHTLRRQVAARARAKAETMTIQKEWRRWEKAWSASTSAAADTASTATPTLTAA